MDENEKTPEPLAVCDTEISDEHLKSTYAYIMRPSTIFYIVIIAFATVLSIVSLIINQMILVIYAAIILVVGVLGLTLIRIRNVNQRIRMYRYTNGDRLHLDFFADYVTVIADRGDMTYEYISFVKAVERESLWLIYMGDLKAPMVLLVPKDGFRNESEYRFFLEKSVDSLDAKKVKRLNK